MFARNLEFPQLTPPPGATSTREGSGESSDEVAARARIGSTTLSPAQLVAHYGAQLSAAGWIAGARLSADDIATQLFTASDRDQRRWQGVFMVMTNGAGRDASLTMHIAADK